jgi:two-component system sensor histidine kinase KdpD
VVVCVGTNPFNDRLIRTGRRVATRLDAELIVIHVETGESQPLSDRDRHRLDDAFQLARQLNARVMTISGRSVADTIGRFAREHNVVKIIVGRSSQPGLLGALRPSMADRLARRVGAVDLYVISTAASPADPMSPVPQGAPGRFWFRYGLSPALMVVLTAVELPMRDVLSPANLVMPYLLATIVIALRWGRTAAIMSSVAGAVLFNYGFIPPYFNFAVTDLQSVMTLLGLLAVGLVTSALAGQVKEQADAAASRETQTAVLYSLSRSLAVTRSLDQTLEVVARHIRETFHRHVAILLPDATALTVRFRSADFVVGDADRAVAEQVFRVGRPPDSEPGVDSGFFPLVTSRGVVGVLGLRPANEARPLFRADLRLLEAMASRVASAIQRELLGETARQAQLLEETDRLQQALLNSISHNLRTPLASITGALSSLSRAHWRVNRTHVHRREGDR